MIIFWSITFLEFFLSTLESEAFMLSKIIILYNIDSVWQEPEQWILFVHVMTKMRSVSQYKWFKLQGFIIECIWLMQEVLKKVFL